MCINFKILISLLLISSYAFSMNKDNQKKNLNNTETKVKAESARSRSSSLASVVIARSKKKSVKSELDGQAKLNLFFKQFSPSLLRIIFDYLRMWSDKPNQIFRGHKMPLCTLAVLSDERVLSQSLDGVLKVWDLNSCSNVPLTLIGCQQQNNKHKNGQHYWLIVPPHANSFSCLAQNGNLVSWNPQHFTCKESGAVGRSNIACWCLSPYGNIIFGINSGKPPYSHCEIYKYDQRTKKVIRHAGYYGHILSMARQGFRYVLGDEVGNVSLASFRHEDYREAKGHTKQVTVVKVLKDGSFVSGSDDTTLKHWDGELKTQREFVGHTKPITCVEEFANGIISGAHDNTVRLWDLRTGQCMQVFAGHEKPVRCLAVLPDQQTFMSGSSDKTVKLWTCCNPLEFAHKKYIKKVEKAAEKSKDGKK